MRGARSIVRKRRACGGALLRETTFFVSLVERHPLCGRHFQSRAPRMARRPGDALPLRGKTSVPIRDKNLGDA